MSNKNYKKGLSQSHMMVGVLCLLLFSFCFPLQSAWANFTMDMGLGTSASASFIGEDADDQSGATVACAGDVDGDGFADFLISIYGASAACLILGKPSGWVVDFDLSNADARFIPEETAAPGIGGNVAGAGDVNGDGYSDFLIAAPRNDYAGADAGQTYLILGRAAADWGMSFSLANADASFIGENAGDVSGGVGGVAGVGDVNGDGFDDFVIGAEQWLWGPGKTYLIMGKASGWAMRTDLSTADASFIGEGVNDWSGRVAGAGDVNGDGYDDFLISSFFNSYGGSTAGQVYLIFGKPTGWTIGTNLSASDASFVGENAEDWAGIDSAGAGDVNGDGFDDFVIGAFLNDYGGVDAGQTYLILGKASGWAMRTSLSDADASFVGEEPEDTVRRVGGAGDVNGDGFTDFLIGAYYNDEGGADAGQTYLIFGRALGWAMRTDLSNADASFIGEAADDLSGVGVGGAGDVNSDGLDDFLIGAFLNDEGGVDAGQSYLFFGSGTATSASYGAFSRSGDVPRKGVGMVGGGSHSIPISRVWVDFGAGHGSAYATSPSLTTVVFHRVPVSTFAPLEVDPLYEWEVSTDRVNYGTAAVTFKGTGERGETDWQGLILKSTDGGATWFLLEGQQRNSVLHEITLPSETLPARYALVQVPDISGPMVVNAVYNDDDDDGVVEAGESVTLIMSHGVVVWPAQLSQASFYLAVSGDSLGGAGFTVASNPYNTRQIVLTLGANASLIIPGDFNISNTGMGQPSGIDIAAGLLPTAIQSLYGVPAVDGGIPGVNDSGVDILYTLVTNSGTIGPAGGTVTVTYSPNAAYTKHSITIPAGALSQSVPKTKSVSAAADVTFTLQPPPVNLGMIGAVQIVASDPNTTFSLPATLTIEYRQSDVDVEMGQTEAAMRVHQLVESPIGVFNWVQLPGNHIVDTQTNTVRVHIANLNPMGSVGSIGIFVNLIGETIEECSYNIAPGGGGAKVVLSFSVPITGGPDSIYELHRIEIPGYQLTTPTDPDRIEVTISSARLIDRISMIGGNSFPELSHAIFVIQTRDAYGRPIAFDSPADMYIEFLDGKLAGLDAFNDVVNFAGERKAAWMMQLVKDVVDGAMVDFQFVEGVTQSVTQFPGGGKVEAMGVPNLTGPSGKGAWGAVARDFPTAAKHWELYR